MKFLRRLRYWTRARQNAADLSEELEFHKSMSRDMGNITRAREDARAVWIWPWLESVIQDLRYAIRSLRAHPGFALISILALGAAIGLNTSFFTVYDAIALRPWPVRDPSSVVKIFTLPPRPDIDPGFSIPEYRHIADHAQSLRGATIMQDFGVHFGFEPFGKSTQSQLVAADYFRLLGIEMQLGRGFLPEEDRIDAAIPVVVLSYATWRDHYSSDPEIIGKTIAIEQLPFTVVGVAPERFLGTSQGRVYAWLPTAVFAMLNSNQDWARNQLIAPDAPCWMLTGRLAPGVPRIQAQAEIDTLSHQFRKQFSVDPLRIVLTPATMSAGPEHGLEPLHGFLLMFAGVTLVVLLACANVGNLLVARAAARRREFEIRRSLGAGRARIIRQLLTESLLLALGAAAFGVLIAYRLPAFVIARIGEVPPVILEPDARVLAYALLLAVISCLAFGLAPALHGTRINASSSSLPLRSVLLAAQVALSVMLLIGATLLLEGVRHMRTQDPGFSIHDVSVISIELPAGAYDRTRIRDFSAHLATALNGHPELQPAALAGQEPLSNSHWGTVVRLPGEDKSAERSAASAAVSSGYFELLRIPIVAGRTFTPADAARRTVLINQSFARQVFGDANPVGKTLLSGPVQLEIIGVVRDSYHRNLDRIEPIVYQPFGGPPFLPKVLIRSTIPGASEAIEQIVKQLDPRARTQTTPLSANLERWSAASRIGAQLAAMLGAFALALATIGMAGVFAYAVQQRTKEIGIRMALGARPEQVLSLVLGSALRAVLAGLMIGALASIAAARLLTNYLYGVSPFDPRAYAIVAVILAVASLAAAFWPAHRAAKIDPMTALRCE